MIFVQKIKHIFTILQAQTKKNSVDWLRKCGAEVGIDVKLIGKFACSPVDATCLKIGNHVTLVGTQILTHDASPQIFIGKGCVRLGRVEIGDNVFVGINSIILPNVKIGNNVVVGAGSVVTRDVPDNSVVAGNPAKVIKSIDAFLDKTKALLSDEDNVIHNLDRSNMTAQEKITLNKRLQRKCIYYIDN